MVTLLGIRNIIMCDKALNAQEISTINYKQLF